MVLVSGQWCCANLCDQVSILVLTKSHFMPPTHPHPHQPHTTTLPPTPFIPRGESRAGQIGDGYKGPDYYSYPTQVTGWTAGAVSFVSVTVGFLHTCGLAVNGTAWCW